MPNVQLLIVFRGGDVLVACAKRVAETTNNPIELTVSGVNHFGSANNARVVFATLQENEALVQVTNIASMTRLIVNRLHTCFCNVT